MFFKGGEKNQRNHRKPTWTWREHSNHRFGLHQEPWSCEDAPFELLLNFQFILSGELRVLRGAIPWHRFNMVQSRQVSICKGSSPPRDHKQRNTTVYILHPESNHILAFLKKIYLRLVFIRTKAKHPVTVQTSNKWGLAKYSSGKLSQKIQLSQSSQWSGGQQEYGFMDILSRQLITYQQ